MMHHPHLRLLVAILCILSLPGCGPGGAPAPGETPVIQAVSGQLTLAEVAGGLTHPVYVTHAGDGSGRLFVLEQPGRIRLLEGSKLRETPFLDITARVNSSGNEQGLLGLAFAPDFPQSGIFYINYTGLAGETVVARYRVLATDPNRGDPDSEEVILSVAQPYANHNGGATLFGPDGYLYIALGDGGGAGDPQNRAQDLDSLLGKILRIDVNVPTGYRIPDDNPFADGPGRAEIWAYGLRNPWRISFDRATGDLFIADVGQSKIEEINWEPAGSPGGRNYGWKVYEGSETYSAGTLPDAVFPVAEYSHELGCSVAGGYVYRGHSLPDLTGVYLYGDYCSGRIWGLRRTDEQWQSTELLAADFRISSFGEDEVGEVYVVDHGGKLYRLVAQTQS